MHSDDAVQNELSELREQLEAVRAERGLLESQNAALSRACLEADAGLEVMREQLGVAKGQLEQFVAAQQEIREVRTVLFRVFSWAHSVMEQEEHEADTFVEGVLASQRRVQQLLTCFPTVAQTNAAYGKSAKPRLWMGGTIEVTEGGWLRQIDARSAYPMGGRVLTPVEHAGIGAGGGDEDDGDCEPRLQTCSECGLASPSDDREHFASCSLAERSAPALDTINAFGITAHRFEGNVERVVAIAPLPQMYTSERALQLASWLIVGAELAGYEHPLETAVATVKAIRAV